MYFFRYILKSCVFFVILNEFLPFYKDSLTFTQTNKYSKLLTSNPQRNLSPPNLNTKIKSKSQKCSENAVFCRHFPNLDSHQTPIIIKSAVILLGNKVLPDPIFSTRYVPINSYEYAWFHKI